MPQERYFKSIEGLELYYREYGSRRSSGPTLMCLPGLTRNGLDYEDLALYLEDNGFRVICPDYRGRGNSSYDTNWRNYNMHTYITDLQNLLFRAQVYRFALIGGSLGGMLAMTMGATLRAMVTGVILNDVGPDLDASGYSKLLDYLASETGHPDEAAAVAHLKEVQAHLNIQDDAGWSRYAHHLYRKDEAGRFNLNWDKGLLKALERGSGSSDLWSLFRKLKSLPVLLLRGQQAPTLFLQYQRGQFTVDSAFAARVGGLEGAVGALLGDFDLDGDLDLVLLGAGTDDHASHRLLLNRSDGSFSVPIESHSTNASYKAEA